MSSCARSRRAILWVDETANRSSDMWVLNPDRLSAYLAHEAQVLSTEEQHLFATHLRRMVEKQASEEL